MAYSETLDLQTFIEQIPAILYSRVSDPTSQFGSRYLFVSPQIETILGYPPAEWLARPELWIERLHPKDRERVLTEYLTDEVATDRFVSEYRMLSRDGKVVRLRDQAWRAEGGPGAEPVWQGALLPLGSRESTSERVGAAELRWRKFVETLPAIVYIDLVDDRATNLYTSPHSQEMLGYTADEWESDPDLWFKIVHPDDLERVRRANDEHETGLFDEEYRIIAKDGRTVWVRDRAQTVRTAAGAPPYSLGLMMDISPQMLAQEERRKSEELFRMVVENARDMIAVLDLEGQVVYGSPSGDEILGYEQEELIGNPAIALLTHPDDLPAAADAMVRAVAGEVASAQVRLRHKDGHWIDVEGVLSPITDADGRPHGILAVARDVTARKAAEEAIAELARERGRSLTAIVAAQEEERARVASYIDADALQVITALSVRLRATSEDGRAPSDAEDLRLLKEAVDGAVLRLHRLLVQLRPPALDREGLAAGIEQYLRGIDDGEEGWVVEDRLLEEPSPETRTSAYRSIQDALDPTGSPIRSGAIVISHRGEGIHVNVRGIPAAEGNSTRNNEVVPSSVRHRVESAGGWFKARAFADGTVQFEFWLPDLREPHPSA